MAAPHLACFINRPYNSPSPALYDMKAIVERNNEMMALMDAGARQKDMAIKYGISASRVSMIRQRHYYRRQEEQEF